MKPSVKAARAGLIPESDYDVVTRSTPSWAWDVIDETLRMDGQCKAFDPKLRDEINRARAAMKEEGVER